MPLRQNRSTLTGLIALACLVTAGWNGLSAFGDPPPAADSIRVEVASWKQAQMRIAAHRGKVVVLNVWSTTCGECVRDFPDFVALHKKYRAAGADGDRVVCLSFNCDYDGIATKPPEFYRPGVMRFLQKHDAKFENLMSNVSLIKLFDTGDLSAMPSVSVFDQDGKLARQFDNEQPGAVGRKFSYRDVALQVDELLNRPQP